MLKIAQPVSTLSLLGFGHWQLGDDAGKERFHKPWFSHVQNGYGDPLPTAAVGPKRSQRARCADACGVGLFTFSSWHPGGQAGTPRTRQGSLCPRKPAPSALRPPIPDLLRASGTAEPRTQTGLKALPGCRSQRFCVLSFCLFIFLSLRYIPHLQLRMPTNAQKRERRGEGGAGSTLVPIQRMNPEAPAAPLAADPGRECSLQGQPERRGLGREEVGSGLGGVEAG